MTQAKTRRSVLRTTLAAATTGGAAFAAACGAARQESGGASGPVSAPTTTVKLEFLHYFTGQLWDGLYKNVVAAFEAKYPTIKWEGISSPYNQMQTKAIALAAGGTPPDGMSMATDWVQELVMRGLMQPLDTYVARDKTLPLGDVFPARRETAMANGKLYGVPIDLATASIYYNKELFDRAGVPYPKDDWTWDDLLDKARRLTVKREQSAVYGFAHATDPHWFYGAFAGQGGEYFDKDLTKSLMDSGPTMRALQWFQELRTRHGVTPTPPELDALRQSAGTVGFGYGTYAMEYAWIGLIGVLHAPGPTIGDKWDTAPLPRATQGGKRAHVVSGGGNFTVMQGAKQPDAAWLFASFMLSDDMQKLLGANGAWFPTRKSLAKHGQPKDGVPKNYMASFPEALDKYGVAPWWYVPGYSDMARTINAEWAPMWRGERSAEATARTLAPLLNEQLKQRPKSF